MLNLHANHCAVTKASNNQAVVLGVLTMVQKGVTTPKHACGYMEASLARGYSRATLMYKVNPIVRGAHESASASYRQLVIPIERIGIETFYTNRELFSLGLITNIFGYLIFMHFYSDFRRIHRRNHIKWLGTRYC